MYYDYNLIVVKREINKKKIALIVIALLIVVSASVYGGIKSAQYQRKKKIQEQVAIAAAEEQRRLEEEQRKEEQRKAEEEARKRKNSYFFSEEQMQKIENIYEVNNETAEKRVFLTFDDGPTTTVTPLILDLLKQENIKATFFVLGNRVKANPDLIKREFDEGHYIANHGYSHTYKQIYSNPQSVLDEYNYTEGCIQEALGISDYHSKVFRFPGGSFGGYYRAIKSDAKQLLRQNGVVSLDWNALTNDADGSHTKEAILESLELTVEDKQSVVVLMHDAHDKILTYETLPDVIQFFRDRGYTFMNLYDIL